MIAGYAEGTRALIARAALYADFAHYNGDERSENLLEMMTPGLLHRQGLQGR